MADQNGVAAQGVPYATLPPHFRASTSFGQEPAHPYLVDPPEVTTQVAQADAEGVGQVVEEGDYIEFMGERFRLADKVSIMPLTRFANAGRKGLDSDEMEGLAAMYSLIRSVIHRPPLYDENGKRVRDENGKLLRDESEWLRFEETAEDEMADGDDIMKAVQQAMEIMGARPTKPSSDSSASLPETSARSRLVSSSRAIPGADGLISVADLGRG